MDEKMNLKARRKALVYSLFTFLVYMVIVNWYATYDVAGQCDYNQLLGGLYVGTHHLYTPFHYFIWKYDANISQAIPDILSGYSWILPVGYVLCILLFVFLCRSFKVKTSHGSASFASKSDIEKSDLGLYATKNGGNYIYKKEKASFLGFHYTKKKKIIKNSGVVVGVNPYTHRLMLHDGVEHILLMAPTRSGKGVNTIIPTGLIWKHSIFFFDPKGELWQNTAGYRKRVLHQKVIKFQPLCPDGSAAHWNPLAEIDYRTNDELTDVTSITHIMVRPDGEQKGGDEFWPNSAEALLNGVVLHLLYQHDKEGLPIPCPSDIMSFLSSPDKTTQELFTDMRDYPHISPEEFLELPILDKDGNPMRDEAGIVIRRKNPLKEIYGEYIKDFRPFAEEFGFVVRSIDEIRVAIQYKIDHGEKIVWESQIDGLPTGKPYHLLLTHPKVAEAAANMLNGADQTRASIMQTAQTAMALYQNPVVQENTKVSDFAIRDMLDPKQAVSIYLVMEVRDVQTIKPLARLFIQMICSKLIRGMKKEKEVSKGPIYEAVPTCPICGSRMKPFKSKKGPVYACTNESCHLILPAVPCGNGKRKRLTPDLKSFACPACGELLERIPLGQEQYYWRCSDYPDCDIAFPDKEGHPDFGSKDEICPACGGKMHKERDDIRVNWVCENFDGCRTSFPDDKGHADRSAKKQRLLLMLDEFPQLGNMKCIELALAICAGYGIKICIVCQDVNQLNKEYTKDNSIGSNCHLHIYFTPNIDAGAATAEAISKTLGKKTIDTVSHSDGGGGFAKGSDSTSQTGRELMTPDEVSHMSSEKELVFVAGHNAIFGDKLRYYLYPFLLNRTKIDEPPISDYVTQVATYDDLFAIHRKEAAEKAHAQKMVNKEQASRLGMTYRDYMQMLEGKKEEREQEIIKSIRRAQGEDDESNAEDEKDTHQGSTSGGHRARSESQKEKLTDSYLERVMKERSDRVKRQKRAQGEAQVVSNNDDLNEAEQLMHEQERHKNIKDTEDAVNGFDFMDNDDLGEDVADPAPEPDEEQEVQDELPSDTEVEEEPAQDQGDVSDESESSDDTTGSTEKFSSVKSSANSISRANVFGAINKNKKTEKE